MEAASDVDLAYCYPASVGQRDLWLQDKLRINTVQNVGRAWLVEGSISADALEMALSLVVKRQSSLRSCFHSGTDGLEIHVRPHARVTLERRMLERHAEDAFLGERQISAILHHRFDLTRGPLIRCAYIDLAESSGVFVVVMHHAISDGWSLGLFVKEMSDAYQRVVHGHTTDLPELEIEYGDFAAHEIAEIERGARNQARAYWRKVLGDPPPNPCLFRSREAMREARMARSIKFMIRNDVVRSIDEVAAESGTTRFAVLLAIYRLTLAAEFGYRDIIVGTPAAARMHSELEPIIGLFATALPLRNELREGDSVRDFVRRVHHAVLEALDNSAYPTLKMIEDAAPERSDTSHPLFKTWFAYHSYVLATPVFGDAEVSTLPASRTLASHELALDLVPVGDEIVATITAPASPLSESGLSYFEATFLSIARTLGSRTRERVGVVIGVPSSGQVPAPTADILSKIAAVVRSHPRKIAVSTGAEALTYEQLWRFAAEIAGGLAGIGVAPGDAVGIGVQRSEQLPALLLGILFRGACYVPLDPSHPWARNSAVLAEANAKILLTDQRGTPMECCPVVLVDNLRLVSQQFPSDVPQGNCAYVMFTSGSTGLPKGVRISRESLAYFSEQFAPLTGLGIEDVVLATTTICFDISILELIVPLTVGATVVVARASDTQRADKLRALIDNVGPSLFQATPTMWRLLLAASWGGAKGLRAVCGGEALTWDLADRLSLLTRSLLNVYGPTEATIWCSAFNLSEADTTHRSHPYVPIGKPIAGVEFLIAALDRTEVTGADWGELCIAGPTLAIGYCGDPKRTSERFGQFLETPTRYYRTGDLAQRDKAGVYSFSGRLDSQVKVRGHRVELGEVDAALLKHPAIREAATVAPIGPLGERGLRAFFVSDETVAANDLRAHLERLLPAYLIPEAFQRVAEMPLSVNGKLDRTLLSSTSTGAGAGLVTPGPIDPLASPGTLGILEIWRELLGQSDFTTKSNFFALGGHSMLVVQMNHKIRDSFGVDLLLSEIYDDPSIEAIAKLVSTKYKAGREEEEFGEDSPNIRGVASFPISQSQAVDLRVSEEDVSNPHAHIAFALRIEGTFDVGVLQEAVNLIFQRHDGLRASFQKDRDSRIMLVHQQLECPIIDLCPPQGTRDQREEFVIRKIKDRISAGIRPWEPPLLWISCSNVDVRCYVLSFIFHHAIVDGWSIGVLLREISSAYRQLRATARVVLPPVIAQMADFTAWERQYVGTARCRESTAYWLSLFEKSKLTTGSPPAGARSTSSQLSFSVKAEALRPVRRVLAETRATPFMASMAAWHRTLQEHEGTVDRIYRVPASNRQYSQWSSLVGALWNALYIPFPVLEGHGSIADVLSVRDLLVSCAPHMEVPVLSLKATLAPYIDGVAYNVGFYNHRLSADFAIEGARIELMDLGPSDPQGNIDLRLWNIDSGLEGRISFLDDVYDTSVVKVLLDDFIRNLLSYGQVD
ncbi:MULTISPECIES: amino acid adenylation domain-containing protein [unclassified Bradyrhizobium]|uniref:non-ribosomal peptide synthetase n=1 Tax=unclassified Bradyrhizobium TaxID=2631580 RepID=UPI00291675A0|nr:MULTISPECIES: amino acid adenylation domain-containing protein [unclassified Bradyrhizobium]